MTDEEIAKLKELAHKWVTIPTLELAEDSSLNRDSISKLDNPIVSRYLEFYTNGWITYEQALIGMVKQFVAFSEMGYDSRIACEVKQDIK